MHLKEAKLRSRRRSLSRLLAASAIVAIAQVRHTIRSEAQPHTTGTLCGRVLASPAGIPGCYAPAKLAQAERQLPIPPVSPAKVVPSLTNLRLNVVGVYASGGLHEILYLFGHPLEMPNGDFNLGSTASHYVIVGESVGLVQLNGIRLDRDIYRNGTGTVTVGPWHLLAKLPHRGLTLTVESNLSREAVRAIGLRIIALSHGGKIVR